MWFCWVSLWHVAVCLASLRCMVLLSFTEACSCCLAEFHLGVCLFCHVSLKCVVVNVFGVFDFFIDSCLGLMFFF